MARLVKLDALATAMKKHGVRLAALARMAKDGVIPSFKPGKGSPRLFRIDAVEMALERLAAGPYADALGAAAPPPPDEGPRLFDDNGEPVPAARAEAPAGVAVAVPAEAERPAGAGAAAAEGSAWREGLGDVVRVSVIAGDVSMMRAVHEEYP